MESGLESPPSPSWPRTASCPSAAFFVLASLAVTLALAGCADGAGDDADDTDIRQPGDDNQDDGTFTSDNQGPPDAGGGSTDITDQDFSSDDPDAQQQEGSSGGRGADTTDPTAECVDREEALAMLEGLEVDLPSCEDDVCTKAHCLAASVIPEDQRDFLADCTDVEKCVPDTLIATLGMAPLPICESVGGAEGRCVSACVPLVRAQADVLPRDICADDELCAPCFDPLTQEATGACSLVCDATGGPVDDPYYFPECCGDVGVCVPEDFVPAGQVALLGADTCSGAGILCAPREFATDRAAFPPTCTSLEGAEGRCLAACLPDVARQADMLPEDDCGSGYLCAPCYDPISGDSTGACGIGDDPGPSGDPVVFDSCCDAGGLDVGVCVPEDIVPESQVDLLGADTCSNGYLCAPSDIAAGSYAPIACSDAPGGAEGRCLPGCLPDVQAQIDMLVQGSTCDAGYYCTPCYDPISGDSTGACELEGDAPVDDPFTFAECCSDGEGGFLSLCVPSALVPADQLDLLDDGGCGGGELCAPKDLADGSYVPDACDGPGGGEGRCLPACLPDVADRAAQLEQADCATGKLCVPCYDPITGEDTGACTLEGDAPVDDPFTFPTCCPDGGDPGMDLGTCVPEALVPLAQRDLLDDGGCSQAGGATLCAPTDLASGNYVPDACSSLGDGEGRCLPACLPDVALQAAVLDQADCDQGELCAPCWDPLTGASTGACELEGDMPDAGIPVYTFPDCCPDGDGGFLSSCVPIDAVPAGQASLLDATGCDAGTELCAPKDIAAGSYVPNPCTAPGGLEARCLPACLPDIASQADSLTQESCATGYLCAPCYDPFTGADTGACTLEGDAPVEAPVEFSTCCSDGVGSDLGTCVPTDLVPAALQSLLDDDGGVCTSLGGDATLCAPTDVATGSYVPDPCTVPGGIEGRCMPACLPDIAVQSDSLTQEDCNAGYLCAPCYDPFTQASTGACDLGGDVPSDPPTVLATCCNDGTTDQGTCVPQSLVPSDLQSLLDDDGGTCTDMAGEPTLCAPTDIATGSYAPDPCVAPGGLEARCLPACLPDIAAQADFLTQETCATGELCAPCYDPFTGADTGACTLEADAPTMGATTFATCCSDGGDPASDLGTCVPVAFVPGDLQSLLDDDGGACTDLNGDGTLCAPTDVATGTYAPEDCDSWMDLEGRCLPACLPDVAAQADQLQPPDQDTCGQGELCVPCYDPLGSGTTGACTLEGDTPAEGETLFPTCCPSDVDDDPGTPDVDLGTCVPSVAAGSAAASLEEQECTAVNAAHPSDGFVCAPTVEALDPSQSFPGCNYDLFSGLTAACLFLPCPGACMPACFAGANAALLDQQGCAAHELCIPCDVLGSSTGACD